MTLRTFAFLACPLALAAPLAAADPSPGAEQLFRDGKQLMKDGKIVEACAAFDASEATEHNVATVMNLADCREKNEQLASAWALYLRVDGETRSDPSLATLGQLARTRASAIEPHLSYLVINVPDENHVEGLIVSRDGVALDPGAWNHAIPLDGGDHVVAAKAPGHEPWATTIKLEARDDKQAVEVPKFSDLPVMTPPVATTPPPIAPRTEPAGVTASPKRPSARAWAFSLTLVGGVAVVAGAASWWKAHDQHRLADQACPPDACTPDDAARANDLEGSASHWAKTGNVWVGIGVLALAGGAYLWLAHGDAHEARESTAVRLVPQLGDAPGFAITGGF
jgi:hypothetical protein